MAMDELGIDEAKVRTSIAAADVEQARQHAGMLLDELIAARRLIHDKLTDPLAPTNPVVLWDAAVEGLRRLARQPAAFGRERSDTTALQRAADWLEAIGPSTDKLPCEVCLKPTDRVCPRCDRSLCTAHAARSARTSTHDAGRLPCA